METISSDDLPFPVCLIGHMTVGTGDRRMCELRDDTGSIMIWSPASDVRFNLILKLFLKTSIILILQLN